MNLRRTALVVQGRNSILYGVWLRKRESSEVVILALLSAVSFTLIDVFYVALHRIRPAYLGDAAVEAALILAIAAGSFGTRR